MKEIVVASTNPVKIKTTEIGFTQMFPDMELKVEGVSAPSGVNDQPMSEEETLEGATNRVNNVSKLRPNADFWVGIEGGQEVDGEEMETFAWVVVRSKEGKMGKGRTGSFFLPEQMVELVKAGHELGEADDIVFGQTNSKQAGGTVGNLTGGVLDRAEFYVHAVILALIPFKNPNLY